MTSPMISTVSTTSSFSNNTRTPHQGMSIPDVLAQQVFIFLNPLEFIQIRTVSLNWHRLTLNPLAIRSQLQVCDVHLESARAIQTMTHLSSVTEETWKKLAAHFFSKKSNHSDALKYRFTFYLSKQIEDINMFRRDLEVPDKFIEKMCLSDGSTLGIRVFASIVSDHILYRNAIVKASELLKSEINANNKFGASVQELQFVSATLKSNLCPPDEDSELVSVHSSLDRLIPASKRDGEMSECDEPEDPAPLEDNEDDGLIGFDGNSR